MARPRSVRYDRRGAPTCQRDGRIHTKHRWALNGTRLVAIVRPPPVTQLCGEHVTPEVQKPRKVDI
jgi:hypothetical protein